MAEGRPFRQVLGAQFALLPEPVRRLHDLAGPTLTVGRAEIVTEPGMLKAILRWFAGLPNAGRDVPVSVRFIPDGRGGERWERNFAGRPYTSRMEAGAGADSGLLIEHFGLFDLVFRLTVEPIGLRWTLARWRWLGLPLPVWSAPRIDCLESGEIGRFTFDIDVAFAFLGPVLRYKGWLEIQ